MQAEASTQPDLVYFAGNNPNGTYVLQALSTIPALQTVTFAGGDGIIDPSTLQAAARLKLSALIHASLPILDPSQSSVPVGIDFEDDYSASGYNNYDPYAASSYDCIMMLIQAIKKTLQQGISTPHGPQDHDGAIRLRQAILQTLAHLTYTGATGTHSFDANGDTNNHTISFYQSDLSTLPPQWRWLQQTRI